MTATATIRPLAVGDLDGLLDLCIARDIAEVGEPNTTRGEIESDLTSPTMRTVGIDRPEGGLAGYAWAEYIDGHETVWGDFVVRRESPAHVAGALFDWLRTAAATAATAAPDKPLWVFADSGEPAKIERLVAAGGVAIRRFFRMLIDLTETPCPPVPELGSGLAIRSVDGSEDDLRAIYRIVDSAFGDHFGYESQDYDSWRRAAAGFCPDLSLYFLATVDGVPAAAVYSGTLPRHGHVDTLGTLREFRGRGLGRALLLTSFAEFERRGITRVSLGVDATNPTGALGLYESVGMTKNREGCRYELRPPP